MKDKQAQKLIFWKDCILKQEQSGQSILKFCQDQGVSNRVFYYYRNLINSNKETSDISSKPSAFVAVKAKSLEKKSSLPDPKWLAQYTAELIRSLS